MESAPRETDSQGPAKADAKPTNGERSRRNGPTLLALTFEQKGKLRALYAKRTHRVNQGQPKAGKWKQLQEKWTDPAGAHLGG